MKNTAALLLLALPLLTGCLGYPKFHARRFKGRAELSEDGKPIKLAATIIKFCESYQNPEEERRGYMRETTTDAQGNYSLTVMGFAWRFKNFVSDANCTSEVQLFSCRPHCKKVDQIDIEMLGK